MLTGLGVERNQEPESSLEDGLGEGGGGWSQEAGMPVGVGTLWPPKPKMACVFQTIIKAN